MSSCNHIIHILLSSCRRVILSSCHPVILSCCHLAILSPCHLVIESLCHLVILSSCHLVILSSCHLVILSTCHLVILSYCHFVILTSCYLDILLSCQLIILLSCHLVKFIACELLSFKLAHLGACELVSFIISPQKIGLISIFSNAPYPYRYFQNLVINISTSLSIFSEFSESNRATVTSSKTPKHILRRGLPLVIFINLNRLESVKTTCIKLNFDFFFISCCYFVVTASLSKNRGR